MMRLILFLTILFSCNLKTPENKPVTSYSDSTKVKDISIKNIRFNFSATRINSYKETIEIKASLYNDNTDTVYFLLSSCDGEQYALRYDTSEFTLTPFLLCNASFPVIAEIAPKEKYTFSAHFRCSSKQSKVKLGFDFYAVDKSFDLKNIHLDDIYNRPADKQTVIWAEEKMFDKQSISARISIPQNSGLAFVNYEMYDINDQHLYVIKRSFNTAKPLINTSGKPDTINTYIYDTLATYSLSKEQLQELSTILNQTDSLGYHTAKGCEFTMGWPRFFIYTNYNGKELNGYVANCYREHIFRIVDFFNKVYPKGSVLVYNKKELITLEANCNKKIK